MMKKKRARTNARRALVWSGATSLVCTGERTEVARWKSVGLGSGAMKAMEKSAEHWGDEGVTMIAGSGDFSSGGVKSAGT